MMIELSATSARSKARVIAALQQQGYRAGPGGVRMAYPFTVLVEDVAADDEAQVLRIASSVEPCIGTILPAVAPLSAR